MFDCFVRLIFQDGNDVEGWVRNASISGALIDTAARLPVYTSVNVVLSVAVRSGRRSIELPACVVRTSRAGVAVEWRDMGVPTLVSLLREAGGDETRLRMHDRRFG